MKKRDNYFKKILFGAYEKGFAGFTRKDIEEKFNLTSEEVEYQLTFLKPDFINNIRISGKGDFLCITSKGISEYFKLKKPWYGKSFGRIILGTITAVTAFLIGRFGDKLLQYLYG